MNTTTLYAIGAKTLIRIKVREAIKLKIKNVKLRTSKLEELLVFYSELFELPVIENNSDHFTIQIGLSSLTFVRAEVEEDNPFYHFAFDIYGSKVTEAIQWLNDKGIILNELPGNKFEYYSKTWDATSIYFYDSAGNIVEFIARHSLGYISTGAFQYTDIINISEIGLVVHNVPDMKETLCSELNLVGYKDGSDTFGAIGDETGLLILSEYQRIWLGFE